eukprot:m51a1_g11690 hypothetical protein (339) ;mRNA; f:4413-6922
MGDAPAAAPKPTKIVFDHVPTPTRCRELNMLLTEAAADPTRFFAITKVAPDDAQRVIKDAIALVDRKSLAVTGASTLRAQTEETAILRSTSDAAFLEAAWSGSKDAEIISAQQGELTAQRSIADLALRCLLDVSEEQVRQSERTGSLLSDCFVAIGEAKAEVRQKEHEVATQAVAFRDMLQRLIENNNAWHDKKVAEFRQEREALAATLAKKDADAEKAHEDFTAILARKDANAQKEREDFAAMLAKKDADAEKARQDFAAVLAWKDAEARKEREHFKDMMEEVTKTLQCVSEQMSRVHLGDISLMAKLIPQKTFGSDEHDMFWRLLPTEVIEFIKGE